eukprot:GHVU01192226.1.p2 GENE.GHVU01192226.1~~GHVU01192226.1.p2  ORF type:complete len:117 (-),score=32.44 GHVU01192226.1:590-940(-)
MKLFFLLPLLLVVLSFVRSCEAVNTEVTHGGKDNLQGSLKANEEIADHDRIPFIPFTGSTSILKAKLRRAKKKLKKKENEEKMAKKLAKTEAKASSSSNASSKKPSSASSSSSTKK